jgi:hypothetical protein
MIVMWAVHPWGSCKDFLGVVCPQNVQGYGMAGPGESWGVHGHPMSYAHALLCKQYVLLWRRWELFMLLSSLGAFGWLGDWFAVPALPPGSQWGRWGLATHGVEHGALGGALVELPILAEWHDGLLMDSLTSFILDHGASFYRYIPRYQ